MPSSQGTVGRRDVCGDDADRSDPTAGSGASGVSSEPSGSGEPVGSAEPMGPGESWGPRPSGPSPGPSGASPGSAVPLSGRCGPRPGRAASISAEPSRRGVTDIPCAPWGLVHAHPCDGEAPVVPVPRSSVPASVVSASAIGASGDPGPSWASGVRTQRPSSLSRLQRTHRPWPLSKLVGPLRWCGVTWSTCRMIALHHGVRQVASRQRIIRASPAGNARALDSMPTSSPVLGRM